MPPTEDEFAEFDTDEATFDAMMAESERVELVEHPAGTTVVVEQGDQVVFRLTVPSGGPLSVATSTVSVGGEAVGREAGRLAAHHRLTAPVGALAS
jgi:hypothetical protein